MNEKIQNLEDRVAALEIKIDSLLGKAPINPQPEKQILRPESPPASAPPVEKKLTTTQLIFGRTGAAAKPVSEEESATRLLPLIAVICFVLAGVFMVRLAIESGWLTAERQWGLTVLLGVALTGFGRWFEHIEKEYRSYLSAAGIIVLYIASFSSSFYFEIFPPFVSLVMATAVSGLCLGLFLYHRSELFPILASVGTYLSPILLGTRTDLIFESAFFILWAVVFSTISNQLRTRTLSLTAAYLGIGVFTLRHSSELDPQNLLIVILILTLQFLSFAYGVYHYSVHNKSPMSQQLAMAYLPILLFFYGTTYYFLDRFSPDLAPWISLIFAAVVYALYRSALQSMSSLQSKQMVQAFLGVILFHSGYL